MHSVDLLLSLLYPPRCPSCGRPLRSPRRPELCRGCRSGLAPIDEGCPCCGEPGSAELCRRCTVARPAFGRARACFVYREDDLSSRLLLRWKYGRDQVVGKALATLLAEHRSTHEECYDVVVPVPLHPSRLARRGFNQAAVLARAIARRPERVAVDALRRDVATTAQAALGRAARQANVRDAFVARRRTRLTGRSVLLVDDVLTTGATAHACVVALLDAGATRVDVWTLARTPQHPLEARRASPRNTTRAGA